MSSDVTLGEAPPPWSRPTDGAWLRSPPRSTASYELWRIAIADGRLERLTDGPPLHLGLGRRPGRARSRLADRRTCARSPTEPPDVWLLDGGRRARRAA